MTNRPDSLANRSTSVSQWAPGTPWVLRAHTQALDLFVISKFGYISVTLQFHNLMLHEKKAEALSRTLCPRLGSSPTALPRCLGTPWKPFLSLRKLFAAAHIIILYYYDTVTRPVYMRYDTNDAQLAGHAHANPPSQGANHAQGQAKHARKHEQCTMATEPTC